MFCMIIDALVIHHIKKFIIVPLVVMEYTIKNFIKHLDGKFIHYEYFYGMKDLLEWLGYEIKMEDAYERNY